MAQVNVKVTNVINITVQEKSVDMKPFEGKRIHSTTTGKIYLCLDGQLRHIPNPKTFNLLFDKWEYQNSVKLTVKNSV